MVAANRVPDRPTTITQPLPPRTAPATGMTSVTRKQFYEEPDINDSGADDDPYTVTAPKVMIEYLRGHRARRRMGTGTSPTAHA